MTDDAYFGYTTGGNRALMDARAMARRMGEDIRWYPPTETGVPYPRPTPSPEQANFWGSDEQRATSNGHTFERIYQRIMAQDAGYLTAIAEHWYRLGQVIEDLSARVRMAAMGLKYGGDGSPDGVGWTGDGADAFLRRGPGATLKSLDDWRAAATMNRLAAQKLAAHIEQYQEEMRQLYGRYIKELRAATEQWWSLNGNAFIGLPRTMETLRNSEQYYRDSYIDAMRSVEIWMRWEAQDLQARMARDYLNTIAHELGDGRATVYEGPRNAIRENPDFIQRMTLGGLPTVPGLNAGLPGMPDPSTVPPPAIPPMTSPPGTGGPGGTPGQPAVPPIVLPPVVPGGGTPARPPGAGLPRVPTVPSLPGGGGATGTTPGVLRGAGGSPTAGAANDAAARPPGMPPPARPGRRPGDPATGLPPVGPEPEAFAGEGRLPPPPVLRGPHSGGTPSGPARPPSARANTGGPGQRAVPPSGVTPPVVGRPRPASPQTEPERRPVRPGSGNQNDFAPPAAPAPPVLGRAETVADAPDQRGTELPGVVRRGGPATGGVETDVARREAPRHESTTDDDLAQLRAMLADGEATWSVQTPGGGVVGGGPQRPTGPGDEPKAQLRGGAA